MKRFIVLAFALSISVSAQNTPAPCDPANLQPTDVQYGCAASPDCITGFICFFLRVMTDVVYGTTCSAEGMYLCGRPNLADNSTKQLMTAFGFNLKAKNVDLAACRPQPIKHVILKSRFWWKQA